MDEMARDLAEAGVRSVFVYTHEAHPSDAWPAHESLDQKLRHARHMVARWGLGRPMMVDGLDGALHQAYGMLPNMTYVLRRGRVVYRASWTEASAIRQVADQLIWEGRRRKERARLVPFYAEWEPQRIQDPRAFMAGMHHDSGARAVDEFIAAVAHHRGDAAARALRTLRDELRET